MILLVDNYDSFTYNLYQYASSFDEVEIIRNDACSVQGVEALAPDGIIISPGPGRPEDAGNIVPLIRHFSGHVPILGVCLGHQAIGQAFGGTIIHAPTVMHGKTSEIRHTGGLLERLPEQLEVMRYHSLIVERATLPETLKVTAETRDGLVMAVEHVNHPTYGIQFHPESIGTPHGMKMIERFISITKEEMK